MRASAIASILSASLLVACGGSSGNGSTTNGSGGGPTTTAPLGGGGEGGGSGSGGSGATGGFTPAPHDPDPQVATLNGPVLKSPKLQIIMWDSDPFVTDVDKFAAELLTTSTWSQQTAEYGVGPLSVLPSIHIAGTAPASFDDETGDPTPFEQYLAGQLTGANPAWGPADPSTMYMFVLPLGTDIKSYGSCCTDFLGYHYEASVGGTGVPYGIACHCPMAQDDPLTPLQYVTTTVIHEAVEMATDPYFVSQPAYAQADDADAVWTYATGGEVSDMCEYASDANYTPPGATYMVQRSWSNAAAKAGKNPCVPVPPTGPYFNSEPVLPDMVSIANSISSVLAKGVTIPVGQSKTIDVRLWSEAETAGAWTVDAYDLNDYLGYGQPNLQLSLDKTTGKNGDVLKLTIEVLSKDKDLGGEGFVLVSSLNGQENTSMGVVGN